MSGADETRRTWARRCVIVAVLGILLGFALPALVSPGTAPARLKPSHQRAQVVREAESPSERAVTVTAPQPRAARAERVVRFLGRVLDESFTPLEGARVVVQLDRGSAVAVSTADGTFEVSAGVTGMRRARVFRFDATHDGGLAGSQLFALRALPTADRHLPDLVLTRGYDVVVRVTAAGEPVAGADVVARALADRVVARGTTGADGRVRLGPLPDEILTFRAHAPGVGRGLLASVRVANTTDELAIELTQRVVRVQVVTTETGAPVSRATVTFGGRKQGVITYLDPTPAPPPTDAQGRSVVSVIAEDTVGVNVRRGAARGWATVPTDADQVRIELRAPRVVRWEVEVQDGELPAEGSSLQVHEVLGREGPEGGSTVLRVEADGLVGEVPVGHQVDGLVVLPDGSVGSVFVNAQDDEGPLVRFLQPVRVEVRITAEDGEPLTAGVVRGSCHSKDRWDEEQPLDETGTAWSS